MANDTQEKPKPWLKQPGEVVDRRGVPIYPGDLVRTFHFIGPRRKRYYLYHTAVYREGAMWMVPTSHLEPTQEDGGGTCLLSESMTTDYEAEVMEGTGPGGCLCFDDRPRRAVPHSPGGRWAIAGTPL